MIETVRSAIHKAYLDCLKAVDPEAVTARVLTEHDFEREVAVVAIGKAAPAMARGAATGLGSQLSEALVISDHYENVPTQATIMRGSHPDPDEASVACAEACLRFVEHPRSNVLFLISGGGSALAELPDPSLTIRDIAVVSMLMRSNGIPIGETNTVRRHLSSFKNGGLLSHTNAQRAVTLVISDVIDGRASEVASGPTLNDTSSPADALRILERHNVLNQLPPHSPLPQAFDQIQAVTPFDGEHEAHVIADRHIAAAAATRSLSQAGLTVELLGSPLTTEAVPAAVAFCTNPANTVTVATGEPTMAIDHRAYSHERASRRRSPFASTRGGRSQSAALAAALELDGGPPAVFAALGTDGIDGPTDAAGAIVDHTTAGSIRAAGLDPQNHLTFHNAHPALDAADALVKTGPTGTNVADIWFFWRSEGLSAPVKATA